MSEKRLTRVHIKKRILSLLVVSIVCMVALAVLGIGMNVEAQQPETGSASNGEKSPEMEAMEATSVTTATSTGHTDIEHETIVYGSTPLQLIQSAPITTSVVVNAGGVGTIVVTSNVRISGTIPVLVTFEGQAPVADSVVVSGTENMVFTSLITQPGVDITLRSTDQPWVIGTLLVTGSGRVTITGTGPVGGEAPAYVTKFLTYEEFMPLVLKYPSQPPSPVVFSDDFSDPSSGWPRGCAESCCFDYYNGYYRVTVYEYAQRCIIPAPSKAYNVNGTFQVDARRVSDPNQGVMYGFFFGAKSDPDHNRWALEVRPDNVWNCYNQNPFFWLSYIENGQGDNLTPGQKGCTSLIYGGNNWNILKVIRNGSNVRVYLNDSQAFDKSRSVLLNRGYQDLEVISWYPGTSWARPTIVYFDNYLVTTQVNP